MKYLVNGAETELKSSSNSQVAAHQDRLIVTTGTRQRSALVRKLGGKTLVSFNGRQYVVEKPGRRAQGHGVSDGQSCAPMPGQIVEVCVKVGDAVTIGDRLLVLEAMKMQQPINSTVVGSVSAVHVSTGDQVAEGQVLVEVGVSE